MPHSFLGSIPTLDPSWKPSPFFTPDQRQVLIRFLDDPLTRHIGLTALASEPPPTDAKN